MKDLAMDPTTNDIIIANGDMSGVDGDDAIAQDLQQALQVWLGEWFLDTTDGMPFKQQILVKNPNLDVVQAVFISRILERPGIVQLLDFNFNYSAPDRGLSIFVEAQTTSGQTITAQAQINIPTDGTIEGTPI